MFKRAGFSRRGARQSQQAGRIGRNNIAAQTEITDGNNGIQKFRDFRAEPHFLFKVNFIGHAIQPAIEIIALIVWLFVRVRANQAGPILGRPGRAQQIIIPGINDPVLAFAGIGKEIPDIVLSLPPIHTVITVCRRPDSGFCRILTGKGVGHRHAHGSKNLIRQTAVPGRRTETVRPLRPVQAISLHIEFILLGFAAEDRMVFDNQTSLAVAVLFIKIIGRSHTGKTAADNHHIVFFTGIDGRFAELSRVSIADQVRGFASAGHIAVRAGVIANAAKSRPGVTVDPSGLFAARLLFITRIKGRRGAEQGGARSDQQAAYEVPTGDIGTSIG